MILLLSCVAAWWTQAHLLVGEVAYLSLPKSTIDNVQSFIKQVPGYTATESFVASTFWADDLKGSSIVRLLFCKVIVADCHSAQLSFVRRVALSQSSVAQWLQRADSNTAGAECCLVHSGSEGELAR
jgi:hypothetical protein